MPRPEPTERRLGLGFLSHIEAGDDPAGAYRDAIETFVAAEQLGYDTGWVIARHFHSAFAGLGSPLVFLAALAERTSRIGLGTGVLVLALDDPIRVAEDAAILDALSGGRVQLGLGSGFSAAAFEAFGLEERRRGELFEEKATRLREVLSGRELNSAGDRLYPPASGLLSRLWRAVSQPGPVAAAARAGDGLQFSRRVAYPPPADLSGDEPRQREIIDDYRSAWSAAGHPEGREPRIALSRSVYTAADRRRALDELRPGIVEWQGLRPPAAGPAPDSESQLRIDRTHYGHPDEVAAGLLADPALAAATELMISFVPARLSAAQTIRQLERFASEVAPHLGWTPREPSCDVSPVPFAETDRSDRAGERRPLR